MKKFIYEDLPLFHNAVFKPIPGAKPELLWLGKDEQVLKRIDLSPMGREEIGDMLINQGFYRKANKEEEAPEEYKEGPYKAIAIDTEQLLEKETKTEL